MLTARDGEHDEARALDTGADDFLAKPFSYVVLLARLRALLRRGSTERPAVLSAGDLSLDPAGHRVLRGDRARRAHPSAVRPARAPLRRKGQVLSKREILEHVWDFSFDGDPNIVEVYVGQLRRRVDEPFGRAALQTVRGVGLPARPRRGLHADRTSGRGSVRPRTTLAATVARTAAPDASAWVLLLSLESALPHDRDEVSRARARDLRPGRRRSPAEH